MFKWQTEDRIFFVPDVYYCLEQAENCRDGEGDYEEKGNFDIQYDIYNLNEILEEHDGKGNT